VNRHPTYMEVIMLDNPDSRERALAIGRSIIAPLQAADDRDDPMESLRFWATLIAYLLGVAEGAVGRDGREAIVQTMRNTAASSERINERIRGLQ
jgi:hypothetical protein